MYFFKCSLVVFFAICLLVTSAIGQVTHTVDYLNPGFTYNPNSTLNINYLRFGTSSDYWAGFMKTITGSGYGNDSSFCIFTYNNRDLHFRTGSGNVTIFTPGDTEAKVGIGTTNPNRKLDVNGTIGAKEIIVTETGWSDFVFEEDYELMPLKDLEKSIRENKKLPDIPSEKEVRENGVSLGEMQAKLLQKIEELTLYVIEQHKLLESQKIQISQIKSENEKLKKIFKTIKTN